jgi:CheY-like chemotaxis protein
LGSNAVKFSEAGTVTLSALLEQVRNDQVALRFEVQATGEGFSLADQPRSFQAFEQADGSCTRHHGGTGLGLAISQRLVELMGGKTGVTSQVGLGSTFGFRLTLRKAVEMAQRVNYGLIFMDLQMPVMDGLEAPRQIRALRNNPSVPIIAMTANVFSEAEARCRGAGMDDFLGRPAEPEALFANVLKWLERSVD